MAHLTPSSALESCETALRQLLVHVLAEKHGSKWMTKVFNDKQLAGFTEKREYEQKKRTSRGVAVVSNALIDYTQFFDLVTLAEKNWELVAPALGKKADTLALLRRIDDLRNTVAHNRTLLPFEEDLVAGIAGEIRNRVTIYMSTQDETGDFYARIEEVTDSFGNRLDGVATLVSTYPSVQTDIVLSVGQTVTFRCRASDPQGRPLSWQLTTSYAGGRSVVVKGADVELRWEVTDDHVSTQTYVWIRLIAEGRYHRWSEGFDGLATFMYRVDPPTP
ncbi:Swt1 family HEPN domain-containing protein [Curtobacterium sp. L1-20]|uniref:Swt1 family HEPN domain-containing protein n=1 Tax=Curtobacterium sp. L1-20 TaxID=3138181 RepID=UPI003B526336